MHLDALSRRVREANGIVSDGSDTERRGEHSQSSVQSLSMPINRSNELDDALSIWIITLYHKFDCLQFTSFPASGFRNRLVYSSMEGLDEAWAVKFLFSAQHGVGTDVEGNEPQIGNFHEFPMSIFRDSAEGIESCLS